jgi:hypothetical protein
MMAPRISPLLATGAFTSFAIVLVAGTIYLAAPDYANVRAGRIDAGYLESSACKKCHEENYATWHATFHRTMTQEANRKSVLGDFDRDNTITYEGVRAEMFRQGDSYWMQFTGVDGKRQ